jgi:hypothetical protein
VNDELRIRLGTQEDLERDFPLGFVIGFPVRPPTNDTPPQDFRGVLDLKTA